MTIHKTGTRDDRLAARLDLLKDEKDLMRRGDELAQRRQGLPWVRIDKEYRFETDEGAPHWRTSFRDAHNSSSITLCSAMDTGSPTSAKGAPDAP